MKRLMKNKLQPILLFALVSCSSYNEKGKDVLNQAETLMTNHPNSARQVLTRETDAGKTCTKADYMKYLLLKTEALNKTSLESVYRTLGMADSVYKYAELFANANDSENLLGSANEISRMQALYNLTESQQLAWEKTQEVDRLWKTLYLIVATLVIVTVISYYYNVNRRKREKEALLEINQKYSEVLALYTNAREEWALLHSGTADLIQMKEQEIEELKRMLGSYQENSNPEKWDREQSLLTSDIVQRMHRYAARATVPSGSEWNDLREIVKKQLPEFYAALYRNKAILTDKEWNVCILTRLHFIPTEIAALLGLSKQRVSNLRMRINRKLFQKEGAKTFNANIRKL